jgi:endonuclease G
MKSTFSCALFIGLFATQLAQAKVEAVVGPVAIDQNPNLGLALPQTSEPEILISRNQYVISYNRNRRAPNWVAWKLEDRDMGKVKRTNNFTKDPDLDQYLARMNEGTAVDFNEYNGSCFERGHQIPSADRTDSTANNEETFMMSNMIPQTPYLNEVVWNHLEQYTRELVKNQGKKIYAIAGPVYDLDYGKVGPKKDIPVPSKDFKILIVLEAGQTPADINANTQVIAALMPNTLANGVAPTPFSKGCAGFVPEGPGTPDDWKKYQSTVKDIERISGISFGQIFKTVAEE